jgi:hypothetical protein
MPKGGLMKTYKIKRVKDGKFANQSRFYGSTAWGQGQLFQQLKAAKSNMTDLIYKRESNFPWGAKHESTMTKAEIKSQPKNWGTLQLIEFSSELKDKDLMETRMKILMEA